MRVDRRRIARSRMPLPMFRAVAATIRCIRRLSANPTENSTIFACIFTISNCSWTRRPFIAALCPRETRNPVDRGRPVDGISLAFGCRARAIAVASSCRTSARGCPASSASRPHPARRPSSRRLASVSSLLRLKIDARRREYHPESYDLRACRDNYGLSRHGRAREVVWSERAEGEKFYTVYNDYLYNKTNKKPAFPLVR